MNLKNCTFPGLPSLIPRPSPAFRQLQYGSFVCEESLGARPSHHPVLNRFLRTGTMEYWKARDPGYVTRSTTLWFKQPTCFCSVLFLEICFHVIHQDSQNFYESNLILGILVNYMETYFQEKYTAKTSWLFKPQGG